MSDYLLHSAGGIDVCWRPELDGGGRGFGSAFVPIVARLFGRVDRVFEFCAGPGFIGFSLLAEGLCNTLALADVNPDAVDALRATVARNGLQHRVSVHLSDGLDGIPPDESWDLVVGNPPMFEVDSEEERLADIRTYDSKWRIHASFYANVARFLKPHGSILLVENYAATTEEIFKPFIKAGGLEYVQSLMYGRPEPKNLQSMYFVWSRHADVRLVSGNVPPEVVSLKASEMPLCVRTPEGPWRRALVCIENDGWEVERFWLRGNGGRHPRRVLTVPPRSRRSSQIFLVPPGPIYVTRADRVLATIGNVRR